MFGLQTGRPAILIGTLKVVACVGFLALAAAQWLSSGKFDRDHLSRLAGLTGADPLTTGSITPARPGATRLDPCKLPTR